MSRVLVIEDDAWLADVMLHTLKKHGHETRHADDGVRGMELVDEELPDVIFLDVLLPHTTAYTFLHELQSYTDTGKIDVILCTGLADMIALDDVVPYGVRRILDKSTMQPEDIVGALRSLA